MPGLVVGVRLASRDMAGKLSQPGCHINTGTGNRSGRSMIMLEELIPESSYPLQRKKGRLSSVLAMRGSVRKQETKKQKKGKKLLGRRSSFLQFGLKPVHHHPSRTKKEDVQLALKKFRRMCSTTSARWSSLEVLAFAREEYPHLFINRLHSGQGHIPGIEAGALFGCRAELCLVGLHRPPQAGIDWKVVPSGDGNLTSIALSIVASGGYEDDYDEGEKLIYTGEGGKNRNGTGEQCEDQYLKGGNMALRNSFYLRNSIRVIRGRPDANSSCTMLYSYDGLYKVVDWRREPGISKFAVYKFKLVREGGQKPLHWHPPVRSPRRVLRGFQSCPGRRLNRGT